MVFKKGDNVKWVSKSGGMEYEKKGKVLEVIPAGNIVTVYARKYYRKYSDYKIGYGSERKHESYLVLVGRYMYWPRVCHLRAQ